MKKRNIQKRQRKHRQNIPLLLLYTTLLLYFKTITPSVAGVYVDDESDELDDLLAEILAEEERAEAAYHAQKTEEASTHEHYEPNKQQQHGQKSKMKGGSMPKGANIDMSSVEEELRRREAEAAAAKAARAERAAAEDAERRQKEREAAFEAELLQMSKDAAKAARAQKKRDAAVVRRILKASESGRHYEVLGLRRRQWQSELLGEVPMLPSYFRVTTRDVKKAYRNLARAVHPDKNKDGRAEEAFDALEQSHAVLSDDGSRKEYDAKLKRQRLERKRKVMKVTSEVLQVGRRSGVLVFGFLHKIVLGPFSTPLLVLGSLII